MSGVIEHVDVDVPVRTAYDQWTQFEEFPHFMEGVEEVRQLSDKMTHWTVEIAGIKREFDAEITEQLPDERIAWRSTGGTTHAGVVTFHRLDENSSRVSLQLEFDPHGVVEQAGDKLGVVDRRAKGDLQRFKQFIERRGQETGAWRGSIERPVP
ncbi:cyclase [Micromonospora sonchi]|uniref:Cyclase n=1 Tax=Micromonospora sonchi TaxID=1763543 RepID=A0A917WZN6_9ACTN|nr:SRPBCC family protein [Micromonospora sonchi]GGM45453.1 cyclase [Micromonospora sonchi]